MSNKRILYFDSLKFFAIWLVVFGHYLMEIDCGSVGFYTNQVIYIVCSTLWKYISIQFYVFFFLGGLFYWKKQGLDF